MGAAAYNRGSKVIRQQTDALLGIRPPADPTPRPATWGEKAKEKALKRARSILRSVRRYGRETNLEILAGAVEMVTGVALTTATEAARIALDEEAKGDPR